MLMALAGLSSALSIGSSLLGNSAQDAANKAAYKSAQIQNVLNYNKKVNDINYSIDEVNRQIGMELTQAEYQEMATSAKLAASIASKGNGVYTGGATTQKRLNAVKMSAELKKDSIQSAGEANVQKGLMALDDALLEAKNQDLNNRLNYSNASSQLASPLEMLGGAAMAGFSTYTAGAAAGIK